MRFSPIWRLIAGTTLIRLAFAATTGLGVDESYMVSAGRVLSLGYFDHPPASWWLSWAAIHILGSEAPVAVRLPFILLFALSQFLVWRIGCLMAGQKVGFWAAVAFNLSPVFGVTTATWVLPDGPLDAALLCGTLCLLHALPSSGRRAGFWWACAGLFAGLALFAKYSAVLSLGGVLVYLIISPAHRHWLGRPGPYLAAIIAIGIFSPVLVWNANHHWASFAFQGDRAIGRGLRPLMPVQTLLGEALFVLPWFWLPMVIALIQGFGRGAIWNRRLLACMAAPPILGFALVSMWSGQRILYHWAAPGYLMLFPLLGEAITRRLHHQWVRRGLAGSAALVVAAMTVIACQLQFDFLRPGLSVAMVKDPSAEGVDWTSLRDDLRVRNLLPPGAVVAALNWRDAGKIGYALGDGTTTLCLSSDSRQFAFAYPVSHYLGQDVLLLIVEPAGRGLQQARDWFQDMDVLKPTSIELNGRVLRTVTVVLGHGLRSPL